MITRDTESDVLVVGGGVAGLHVAHLMAGSGVRVRLLEAKPDLLHFSFKTLGSFLEPEKYGFSRKIVASELTSMVFHSRWIHTRKHGPARILDKAQVHRELLEKCQSNGVDVLAGTSIKNVRQDPDGQLTGVIDQHGTEHTARLYVDCSGGKAVLTHRYGLMDKHPQFALGVEYNVRYKDRQDCAHLFYGENFREGYGWIFPLGGERAIVGFGSLQQKPAGMSLRQFFERILALPVITNLIEKDNDDIQGGAFPISDVKTKFFSGNVVGIGDSVSQGSPLLGEGYRFILEAASIAAPHLISYLANGDQQDLQRYEREWNDTYAQLFHRHKKLQRLALRGSRNDLLADTLSLMMKTKRSKTFGKLISGDITSSALWFP